MRSVVCCGKYDAPWDDSDFMKEINDRIKHFRRNKWFVKFQMSLAKIHTQFLKKTHFLSVAVPSERYLGQNYKYSHQNYSMHKLL